VQIIAGSAKGRILKSLPGLTTRPILARIKKSLFDIIKLQIGDSRFLDLYAGTGAVGIEALSRGARLAIFIEKEPAVVKIIRENLRLTRMERQGQVIQGNVFSMLGSLGQQYDIIFVGPPYKLGVTMDTLKAVDAARLLAENGIVIAQHHFKEPAEIMVGGFEMYRQEKYGDTRLSFYRRRGSSA
jgi:16S rRNA (guanine966-N2)-methyltransferase